MSILAVRGYTKRFEIHHITRTVSIFRDISFDLHEGEFLLVSGRNGVGKSALLHCLFRSYLPTAGSAHYASLYGMIDLATAADVDILALRREEIGHVTQFLRPRPRVSALELVAEPLVSTGVAWDDALRQASGMLEEFGLNPALWNAYPTTFSGGEQQKVNVARALMRPRRLLLLDEPTASLDVQAREALAHRLAWLKSKGVAMMGILHHREDVEEIIDTELPLKALDKVVVAERMEI